MLTARKALFLGRGNDFVVIDQRCSAVMIESGNAEYTHQTAGLE